MTGRQTAGEASEAVARKAHAPRFAWGIRRSLGTVRIPGGRGGARLSVELRLLGVLTGVVTGARRGIPERPSRAVRWQARGPAGRIAEVVDADSVEQALRSLVPERLTFTPKNEGGERFYMFEGMAVLDRFLAGIALPKALVAPRGIELNRLNWTDGTEDEILLLHAARRRNR